MKSSEDPYGFVSSLYFGGDFLSPPDRQSPAAASSSSSNSSSDYTVLPAPGKSGQSIGRTQNHRDSRYF